jgi:hypothetical protein
MVFNARNHVKTLEKMLRPLETEGEFFALYDALLRYNSGFAHNREGLLGAWKRGGELYTLNIVETQALFENHDLRMKLALFADPENPKPSWLNLPIFCWKVDEDVCIMMWTAPHMRKLGLARELLDRLGIAQVRHVVPESWSFWQHLAIPEITH